MSTKLLNCRQARWSEFLSHFDFRITYRPGKAAGKPDALTWRSGDLPKEGDERLLVNQHAVLKPQNLSDLHRDRGMKLVANNFPDAEQPDAGRMDFPGAERIDTGQPNAERYHVTDAGQISTLLAEVYQADPFPERILGLLRNGARQCKEISLADCKERNGRLIYWDCIYVPDHVLLRL